jgi:hypothetical protein
MMKKNLSLHQQRDIKKDRTIITTDGIDRIVIRREIYYQ